MTTLGMPICECNDASWTGLPCSHLIALCHHFAAKTFLMALIDRRWIATSAAVRIPEFSDLSLEECDEVEGIASEDSGEKEEEEAIQMGMSDEGHNLKHADVENGSLVALHERDDPRTRYLSIFHLAKQIVQTVSNAPWSYEELIGTLAGIFESLSEPVDGEIRDAAGRQKGSPRQIGNSHSAPAQTPCPRWTCLHGIEKCRMYKPCPVKKTRDARAVQGKINCTLC
jgi:hypothetical protein